MGEFCVEHEMPPSLVPGPGDELNFAFAEIVTSGEQLADDLRALLDGASLSELAVERHLAEWSAAVPAPSPAVTLRPLPAA